MRAAYFLVGFRYATNKKAENQCYIHTNNLTF